MSKFLAPIHTWLSNKILVLEDVEKAIVSSLDSDEQKAFADQLQEMYGQFTPNEPLESLIDQSNIHGWLQDKITRAESRQAALVSRLMADSSDAAEGIANIYYQEGLRVADRFHNKLSDAREIFSALNNVLLEGMPCDRVNAPVEESQDKMVWKTAICVHKNNWENKGVDVAYYYAFREAFTKGFVETIGDGFSYTYSNAADQIHTITK